MTATDIIEVYNFMTPRHDFHRKCSVSVLDYLHEQGQHETQPVMTVTECVGSSVGHILCIKICHSLIPILA